MLLQQILEALDSEIERLAQLRDLVDDLQGSAVSFDLDKMREQQLSEQNGVALEAAVPAVATAKRSQRVAGTPRTRTAKRRSAQEVSALSGPVPSGPVVVSRAALAKETATKRDSRVPTPHEESKPEPGSLGSMIRALRLDATA